MYTTTFEYHRAGSAEEAVRLLAVYGDEAKLLAGGHSLIPLMKLRLARPGHLIDIRRAAGLTGVTLAGERIVIGAATPYRALEESAELRRHLPMLAEAAGGIGDPQVRNMGTIGGSLAHADPAADLPAVVLALGAELVITGPRGERVLASDDFFRGLMATALEPNELLREIRIPIPPAPSGGAYLKHPHPASGFAVVGVAALVGLDAEGRVQAARVALTGVAPRAQRAGAVERALVGLDVAATKDWASALATAADLAAEDLELHADRTGSADYRRSLVCVTTRRALERALARAWSA